jgi:dephospho-CoA kinase
LIEFVVRKLTFELEEAEKRINSQLSNEERAKVADVVFDTDRDASFVKQEVIEEWNKLLFAKY